MVKVDIEPVEERYRSRSSVFGTSPKTAECNSNGLPCPAIQRPGEPTKFWPFRMDVQLLFPLFAAAHESDRTLKIVLLRPTEPELFSAGRDALLCDGRLNPRVGGLSQGKYPVRTPSFKTP